MFSLLDGRYLVSYEPLGYWFLRLSGLFCLLQMPHRIGDEATLKKICLQLNSMEMAAHKLPPQFGAWCPGRLGDNPSYVSFLPNALHKVPGIAVNVGFWAANRAQWANAMLASLGVPE